MRTAQKTRKTAETDIFVNINLDGNGTHKINTGIPFFDHMLSAFSKHSRIDIELKAVGDIEVDYHHTIEDTGIILGSVFKEALGDKKGIVRFADATVPLDEALVCSSLDISGRSFLHFGLEFTRPDDGNGISPYIFEEFFRSFTENSFITLHIDMIRGKNSHHIIEAAFKSVAKSIQKAVAIAGTDIPSTKGVL